MPERSTVEFAGTTTTDDVLQMSVGEIITTSLTSRDRFGNIRLDGHGSKKIRAHVISIGDPQLSPTKSSDYLRWEHTGAMDSVFLRSMFHHRWISAVYDTVKLLEKALTIDGDGHASIGSCKQDVLRGTRARNTLSKFNADDNTNSAPE